MRSGFSRGPDENVAGRLDLTRAGGARARNLVHAIFSGYCTVRHGRLKLIFVWWVGVRHTYIDRFCFLFVGIVQHRVGLVAVNVKRA